MSLGHVPSKRTLASLYQSLDYTDHLRLTTPDLGYTSTASTSASNTHANRYTDIVAYDHALLPGAYLNAAYIPPFQRTSLSFVVSQAPLPPTYAAFYAHVVQQRVRVLVNLTPLVEKGRRKADQYWPELEAQMELQNGWTVRSESEGHVQLERGQATLVRRVLHIDTADDGAWSVTQFHLTSWPDHSVFPTSLLLQLMHETQQVAMPKLFPPPPTWIHCSAGVGRSGTFAAALIAQAAINVAKNEGPADALWDLPVRIVEHLRRYRAHMVQTLEQFEAVYEVVAQLARDAGLVKA
ncbi:related to Protein-tyrosine phosphatase gamma precursor [Sporisorium reilianum SRZ2]|uniref:Related to Protein-tyrosine phosphatase gamma n=1 Tax=Sporisorium reilianum (strain SRZ2) TaxID=999809 RepID=E6ZQQ3_SPORE|nr:related to Protein-tyrosine phosphatase gamma precursor [Sporisorium reilianum SRZ2]